jgi:hypothetical protein
MKLVTLALTAAVLSAYASNAAAAPVRQASFCGTAKGVAAYLVHSNAVISPTGTDTIQTLERKLKVEYGAIVKAEPSLLGSAPGSIKPDLRKALAFVNYVNGKMTAVNWDFTKIVVYEKPLVAKAQAARPALTHLSTYFRGKCHIKGA